MNQGLIDNTIANLGEPLVKGVSFMFNEVAMPIFKLATGQTLHDTFNKAINPDYKPSANSFPEMSVGRYLAHAFGALMIGGAALSSSPISIAATIALCNIAGVSIGVTRGTYNRYQTLKRENKMS